MMAASTSSSSPVKFSAKTLLPTFQSIAISNNGSSQQMNGLASEMSDLAIGDRPPPRKIRRRNALTVQDPHYPLITPPPNSPVHDAFEDSSRLQALDEIVHRSDLLETNNLIKEPKRKLAKGARAKLPLNNNEDREVQSILLHKDLEQFKPEGSLPDFLVRKYVKAVKSSLNNPCSALVPYQPPEQMLNEILNKGSSNLETKNGKEASPVASEMDMDD